MSNLSRIVREGWLKKIKNQKKRYFVLGYNKETGAAQLLYYENAKKFSSETVAKKTISLQQCLGIIKKVDERFGNILVLYTKEGVFRLKADTDELLENWLTDLEKLQRMEYKSLQESKYDIVWNVKVIPRGLGGLKNITGSYKLCLKENTLFFINPVTQDVIIEEKLYNIRRFGYSEYCVFMEFGRATALGPGEIWMDVEDPLIAQKIEDSLSRSVRPKSKPERNSMAEDPRNIITAGHVDNNNSSPKLRRPTVIGSLMGKIKGKDITRQHSNSISGTHSGSAEAQVTISKNGSLHLSNKPYFGDDEESEETKHYPRITPPVPSAARTASQSSGSTEDAQFKPRKKTSLDLDTAVTNDYANIPKVKKRGRSIKKQDINLVRQNHVEQLQSSSLPRRTSSSSSSDPSWRRSVGSEQFAKFDMDSDSTRDSDREDLESAFLQQTPSQYLKMTPRKPMGSDSSADEPGEFERGTFDAGTYVPLKPPSSTPDLYVQMLRTPNSENISNTFDSYNPPKEGDGECDPGTYVNMKPGLREPPVTSSSSSDDLPTADTGDESFDHLNRDSAYVNMSPQSTNRGLKKSQSQIQRNIGNAYVNVEINRSKSVGSKTRFRIVSEQTTEDNDGIQETPNSYVNVKANGEEPAVDADQNYANISPQDFKQSSEMSPGKKGRELNYASVEFAKDSPPQERGSPRRAPNRQSNYSKIDFEKSNVLANISSTRERQLHHA